MGYTLTNEEKIVLSELQSDLIKIKSDLIIWGRYILNHIFQTSMMFILSLEDFNFQHIKNKGLGEILYQRALRFFKLEDSKSKSLKRKARRRENKNFKPQNVFQKLSKIIKKIILASIIQLSKGKKREIKGKNVYIKKIT